MKTCQQLLGRDLSDEEIIFWRGYLKQFSIAELRYAFERWLSNCDWFPKPKDIRELAEAYRLSERDKLLPIGCERCQWTGFYEVRRKGGQRFLADCPCRADSTLRSRDPRQVAGREEMDQMWRQLNQFAQAKDMNQVIKPGSKPTGPVSPKPTSSQPTIPTSRELAEQLEKRGHTKFVGGGAP